MLQNPCYDPETHKHCTKRYPGCSGDCPDWDDYVELRDEIYRKRKKQSDEYSARAHVKDKIRKKHERDHRHR